MNLVVDVDADVANAVDDAFDAALAKARKEHEASEVYNRSWGRMFPADGRVVLGFDGEPCTATDDMLLLYRKKFRLHAWAGGACNSARDLSQWGKVVVDVFVDVNRVPKTLSLDDDGKITGSLAKSVLDNARTLVWRTARAYYEALGWRENGPYYAGSVCIYKEEIDEC